ncbi:hypothetical protein J3E64_002417 [Sphingobium sp. OAS761]|uniref:hypothetical protein n=1 Tax=Sphingobium sp. OAS761 TaxID=2817901 RepID=UPI0020A085F5|nr:hypothetical protein [Sphingobium sp. OAS761]MCP1470724.1 hypothetical protein [Sphingobium sp. OAS761]
MNRRETYRAATMHAQAQRGRMIASAQAAKARIAPSRLKQDAIDKMTAAALDGVATAAVQVQQKPVAFGAAAGAFLLYLARRPLAALFGGLYVRLRNTQTDTPEIDDA